MENKKTRWNAGQIQAADSIRRLPAQFFVNLVDKAVQQTRQGHDVINLGQGNPDLPTPQPIVHALQKAAENPKYHRYSPFRGYSFVKEAVANRYREDYGVELDPETEVAVMFGSKAGLVEICQCLLNPGDVCLMPDPGYPDYWSGVALTGAQMVTMPLVQGNDFLPDYTAISADDANAAKLMFVNYPNNPTAAVASADFYQETVRFAEKYNIVVASDLAYGAIGYDGHKPPSFLQTEGAKEIGVEFYTMSKTYNMAGWRIAFAVGNAHLIELINLIQDHYHCSLFGGLQEAAAEALNGPQDAVAKLLRTYESRRNVLFEELGRIGWQAKPSAGSFFAWLPVPGGYSSAAFSDLLLDKAKVVSAPGIGFGKHGEGYVRMGLLTSEDRLREAAERIGRLRLFD